VSAFLRKIGVPEPMAELDADTIEPHVSLGTRKAFGRMLESP